MTDNKIEREKRLAEALRANLRKRKGLVEAHEPGIDQKKPSTR
jgi:hypothetical protein